MIPIRFAAVLVITSSLCACAQTQSATHTAFSVASSSAIGLDAAINPDATMLRFPDVGPTHIVFVYADDLWIVPRAGGLASPLASPKGLETFPKFSDDGGTIAFVGNYDGNTDLYTLATTGGVPRRVTYHPAAETLCGWTPDGALLYYSNAFTPLRRQTQLLTINPTGGLPEKLPPPYGANGAISPSGEWLAFTPHTRDARTWKRYRGGMATDIWLLNLNNNTSKKITDWEGTDTLPMWRGDTVYYLSDAGAAHRLNIWSYELGSGRRTQITKFADYDVKWPSIGPGDAGQGEIVFQNGSHLYLLNLQTGKHQAVHVKIPGDRPTIRAHAVDAGKFITAWDLSATGKRALVEARGDLWTIPAKNGAPRNLTRTSGLAERDPSWSPDGRWIAFFCDKTDEYELYITQSDGKGETKQLTNGGGVFRFGPTWSPDSKLIAFSDKAGAMFLHDIEAGETKQFDTEPKAGPTRFSWSSDSQWIAYGKSAPNNLSTVVLYNVKEKKTHRVTAGMFNDTSPTFDRKGDYLLFASNRDFSAPVYEDLGTTFVYSDTDMLVLVPLRDEVGSPWAPKSDEEKWKDDGDDSDDDSGGDASEEDADGDDKDADSKDGVDSDDDKDGNSKNGDDTDDGGDKSEKGKDKKKIDPVEIELDGFERRALKVPVKRGSFSNLAFSDDGKLLYIRGPRRGSEGKAAIHIFDLEDEKKEEKTVVKDARAFVVSADGKKMLVLQGEKQAIVEPKPDQKMDKPLSLTGMTVRVNPRAQWQQIFSDAWRIERDYFYDPNMHGVDWKGLRRRYEAMLVDCVSRRDVAYVIGELISEINVGHTYVRGFGDVERAPRVSVGMLGCDYELVGGAYRITKIYEGAPWDIDARGPLSEPGVDVKEGDYLLAVNGVALDVTKDPWSAFQGLAGQVVTITVSEKPISDDDVREVVVKPLGGEGTLRYRAWIERNRAYVAEQTNGQVGYIYVPDTGVNGQNNLVRQFSGQIDRAALVIDERWNGGGQIPSRFIELLNRPALNYWAVREGRDWTWPPDSHQGPKCMLINGLAGSGGDCFPYYFRETGLGKLIGMRTWGGLVGYSGNPRLIDGGTITSPSFAFYERDGTWGIEGHGVDPDIEVIDDPALMLDGGDPQLDAAIKQMLREIKRNGYHKPDRPQYPDRSGMGVVETDK